MFPVSNVLISLLNLLCLIVSIPILCASLWFRQHAATECQKFLELPLLVFGGFLFFVALLGLIGSGFGVSFLFWIYLFFMFSLMMGFFVFTVFSIAVTNKGAGRAIAGTGYKEYKLGDYSNWLRKRVLDGNNWVQIKSCLIEARVCQNLSIDVNQQAAQLYKKNLSPVQSGCCKPPIYCGFIYENATVWLAPKSGPAVPDSDCITWSNKQDTLCYDCKSCKAGILASLHNHSKGINILLASIIVFLLLVYSVGCCALRNNHSDGYQRYRSN